MSDVVKIVLEYKRRLKTSTEYKTILRTLQKLNKIEMDVEILRATKIGKTLNTLSKHEEYGEFAKEIVTKWKRMVEQTVESPSTSPVKHNDIKYDDNDTVQGRGKDEYDPSGNWEVMKKKKKEKKQKAEMKYEVDDLPDGGYDPSKNWKMKKNEDSNPVEEYVPQKKPHKQNKNKEEKIRVKKKNKVILEEEKRKAELKAIMEKAQAELKNMETTKEEDSDHKKMLSDREEEEHEEEDETPGAYFFSSTRRTSANSDAISEDTPYSPTTPGIAPTCNLVSSTTLYSRSKSQESEEGIWNQPMKLSETHEAELSPLYENASGDEYEVKVPNSAPDYKPAKEKIKEENQQTKNEEKIKNSKIKNKISNKEISNKSTVKRKSNGDGIQPRKKKSKKEKSKTESKKSTSQTNGGPSFEDFMKMDVVKKVKKKKKNSSVKSSASSSGLVVKPAPEVKPSINVQLKLPEIQTTYRPLPHMTEHKVEPSVQDHSSMTDDMAAELHSQRKYSRRGLFSGANKFIPKMIPLFDMCIQVLLQHIDALDVIGVPYEIIEPVLKKCNPDQLYHLEDVNPYFLESSDELWKHHARRDFPRKEPDEMESWRELYWRLHDERNQKLAKLTKKISAKEAQRRPLEKKLKLAYVGQTAKAPRGIRRAQEKYGTNFMSGQDDNPRKELVKMRSAVLSNPSIMHSRAPQRSASPKKVRSGPLMSKALKEMKRMRFKR